MQTQLTTLKERARYAGYGLAAGLVVGIILGWMLHGLVALVIRLSTFIVIAMVIVGALYLWRKVARGDPGYRGGTVVDEGRRDSQIRDRGYREPRIRDDPTAGEVTEATWRDLSRSRRDRRP